MAVFFAGEHLVLAIVMNKFELLPRIVKVRDKVHCGKPRLLWLLNLLLAPLDKFHDSVVLVFSNLCLSLFNPKGARKLFNLMLRSEYFQRDLIKCVSPLFGTCFDKQCVIMSFPRRKPFCNQAILFCLPYQRR